jgi:hypothetical protein
MMARIDGELVAYAAIDPNGTIFEFHVLQDHLRDLVGVLARVVELSGARKALCKSFDAPMMFALFSLPGASVKRNAILFRRVVDPGVPERSDLAVRASTRGDIPRVLEMHDGFFSGADEVASYMSTDARLFLFSLGSRIVGSGIAKRVVKTRRDFDIGMVVAPGDRLKGIGTHIASWMKHHCQTSDLNPVCGCSAANRASRRALERAGFAAEHQLLEFSW